MTILERKNNWYRRHREKKEAHYDAIVNNTTSCRIGMFLKNKGRFLVKSIYCDKSGFPSGVGQILINNYKDETTIRRLLDGGNIKILTPEIDKCVTIKNTNGLWEGDAKVDSYNTYTNFVSSTYFYLFKDNEWYVKDAFSGEDKWVLVKELLEW